MKTFDQVRNGILIQNKIHRLLVVAFFHDKMEQISINETQILFPVWLMIFLKTSKNYMKTFCSKPPDNRFHLRFNSETIISCSGDSTLYEWYSLNGTDIQVKQFGVWDIDSNNINLTNFKCHVYDRRHDLNGMKFTVIMIEVIIFIC